MSEPTAAAVPPSPDVMASDAPLLALWVKGHASAHTRASYQRIATGFLAFVGKPLAQVQGSDLQAWAGSFATLAPATQAHRLAVVKSLLSAAHRLGHIPVNPGVALRLPKVKRTLAERLLSEMDVHRLLALENQPRNRAILTLLYAAGLRVSELCALCWRDVQPRAHDQAQVTVQGKGGKTRTVLIPAGVAGRLGERGASEQPVFRSRKGGPLHRSQVHRIVRQAAERAGLEAPVSAHWLRHAHASHALERGASIHLVQQTLGHASVATTGVYLHARPSDSSALYLAV